MSLKDKVIFISGGSRGIGLAMVKKAAEDGAKIAIAAKTAEPHPKLPGTIYTAPDEIVEAGGDERHASTLHVATPAVGVPGTRKV